MQSIKKVGLILSALVCTSPLMAKAPTSVFSSSLAVNSGTVVSSDKGAPQIIIVIEMTIQTDCGDVHIVITRDTEKQTGSYSIQSTGCNIHVHGNWGIQPGVTPSEASAKLKVLSVKPGKGTTQEQLTDFKNSESYILLLNTIAAELEALGKL